MIRRLAGLFAVVALVMSLRPFLDRVRAPIAPASAIVRNDPALDSLIALTESTDLSELDAANTDAELVSSGLAAPTRDSAMIAFTLSARAAGSHLIELLDERNGWNFRWPDRRLEPMRVWVQEPLDDPTYQREWVERVRESFSVWSEIGLPLAFTFSLDSARAEVHVTWVDHFDERMTGRTRWMHDRHGWLVGANIQLALHLPDGRAVTGDGVRAIARHEVGHLIGLDHTRDSTSIMAPQVFVTELSEADRRTARLVYELPPGKLR